MNDVVPSYKRAIEINPDHAQAYRSLGVILYRIEAIWPVDRRLWAGNQSSPWLCWSLLYIGRSFYHAWVFQEDADAFKEAFRRDPYCSLARGELGMWFAQLGEKEAALEQCGILKTLDIAIAMNCYRK